MAKAKAKVRVEVENGRVALLVGRHTRMVDLRDLGMDVKVELAQWAVRERLMRAARKGLPKVDEQIAAFKEGRLNARKRERPLPAVVEAVGVLMQVPADKVRDYWGRLTREQRAKIRRDPAVQQVVSKIKAEREGIEPGSLMTEVLGSVPGKSE